MNCPKIPSPQVQVVEGLKLKILVNNRSEAVTIERYIKNRRFIHHCCKGKAYIRKLIQEESAVAKLLAKFKINPPGSVG
ncbi:MAG: hypothetical protein H6560_13050 [Lewinellaceae bacterium]|nr:hypothetical protein [Lewinellaceae bacterium]